MKDNLVEGPFGSNACYEQVFEQDGKEIKTWMCFGSGFTTSTLMTKGSQAVENAMSTSPELYRELMHVDKNDLVWFPSTITLPNKGMVFLDGTSKKDWKWAAIKSVPITEEEKSKFPEGQTHKMDMKSIKHFNQKDFMDALEDIGFFAING